MCAGSCQTCNVEFFGNIINDLKPTGFSSLQGFPLVKRAWGAWGKGACCPIPPEELRSSKSLVVGGRASVKTWLQLRGGGAIEKRGKNLVNTFMIACRLKNVILLSQRPSFRKNKRKLKNYPVIIQCCFTSETHVLMAVFVRKGTSFFNGRGRSYFNGGASFLDGVGAPLGICFDGGSFQKLILLCPMPPPPPLRPVPFSHQGKACTIS